MATELAKAYVQIIPSAQGIKGSISDVLDGESKSAGESAGLNIASKIKTALIAAGIGKVLKEALTEGAALEQSLGGIETLFKDSADKVKANAEQAYRTAGLSANEYMELTTSFAASLLQSTANDTERAADIADMAMIDMSDNANKMGTDMASIQNAYQGFAKQNYTMLDNLKLGYGGTKSEMERLLADAEKLTGVKYDISNLADVYEAIHVIQGELDITGTTAEEAATTFSGSLSSMQAAFKNVLGQLMLGQDLGPALNGLAETMTTFLVGNFLPALWNIISALPSALVTFIRTAAPQLVSALMEFLPRLWESITAVIPELWEMAKTIVANIVSGLTNELPQILEKGKEMCLNFIDGIVQNLPQVLSEGSEMLQNLIQGITTALPGIVSTALEVVTAFLSMIIDNLPQILDEGTAILMSLVEGILNALPQILVAAGEAIATLLSGLLARLPDILSSGFELVSSLIRGIGNALPGIATAAGQLVRMLWDTIVNIDWLQLGKDIIWGIINGIGSMAGALWDAAWNIASSALNAIKGFFGIASPSTVMRDEVGKFIPSGVAVGIEANTRPVTDAMHSLSDLTTSSMQHDISAVLTAGSVEPDYTSAVSSGVVITINVYGAQGQDVMSLARAVSRVLQDELEQKELVFA